MDQENVKLYFAVSAVNLLSFATGNAYAWASSVLVGLKGSDPTRNPLGRPVTHLEESWIAALISLGATCGPSVAGWSAERYGRKRTLLAFAVPMLVANLMLAIAGNIWEFYLARFMVGLGAGAVFTVIPMYVGEISRDSNRGLLGTFLAVGVTTGLLFGYAIGPNVDLRSFSLIQMAPILGFLILFGTLVPESPYYHASNGNNLLAEASLRRLRSGGETNILKELNGIKETIEESRRDVTSFIDLFRSRKFRRGITVTVSLMIFQQCIGITIILSYMENIFIMSGSPFSSATSTIVVAIFQTITVIVSSSLIEKLGRRTLMLLSATVCAVSCLVVAVYFVGSNVAGGPYSFVPVLGLVTYMIGYNLGYAAVPWALTGELFSAASKSTASTITATVCLGLAFVSTVICPSLRELIGFQGLFFGFGGSAFLSILFIVRCVPETKGKSFHEILEMLEV